MAQYNAYGHIQSGLWVVSAEGTKLEQGQRETIIMNNYSQAKKTEIYAGTERPAI